MTNWQPIDSAPKDGSAFQARIEGHGADNVICWQQDGLLNDDGDDCGSWCFASDQEPPESWTDGWWWQVNEDGVRSADILAWKPLPPQEPNDA